jgi:hypothetical protein
LKVIAMAECGSFGIIIISITVMIIH